MLLNLLGSMPGAAAQGLVWGVMALGVFITYKILDIADLTVDGSICTGAAVCTMLMVGGMNPWLAMLIAFLAGALCGLVTGALHIYLGIPAILAGILTQMALWSINLKILGKANQALSSREFPVVVSQMRIPKALLFLGISCIIIIAVLYWFFGTELGRNIRATGSNEKMSRAQGINTNSTKLIGLALSNALVALSGALLAQYQGYTDINMGRGAVVIGLAAVVIGQAFSKLIGVHFAIQLSGIVFGAIVYYVVYQVIIFMGLDTNMLKMFSAIVVALFLGIPYLKKKFSTRYVGGKK